MYYFKWGEKVFCVDATEETNRLGSYELNYFFERKFEFIKKTLYLFRSSNKS